MRAEVPEARLLLVGAGLSETEAAKFFTGPGVEVTGFVEDLEPVYAQLRVSAVPLESGAGVKFKLVEALVRGIPTVATPVGAERIGNPDWFTTVADDDAVLVAGILAGLCDPVIAQRAHETAHRVQDCYGVEAFQRGYQARITGGA